VIDVGDLTKLHTKQLMAVRRALFSGACGDVRDRICEVAWNQGYEGFVHSAAQCASHPGVPCVSMAEVKAELAKRGHVPNKAEARAARQAKAKGARA
jgi:hypothetical protein